MLLFLSVYVDEKQNLKSMCKKFMKLVELGEPTPFLDHVYLGCSRTKAWLKKLEMFEAQISAGATEELFRWKKLHAKAVARSYDMEGHAKQCVDRCCELANKTTEQLYKVATPCMDDHHFKKEESCQKIAHKLFLKCRYLARIGWLVTTDTIAIEETQISIVEWVSSKTRILLSTLKTLNQLQCESFVFPEVEHGSTESEVFSLGAGFRMNGLFAVDLWDVVIEVLHSSNNTKSSIQGAAGNRLRNSNTKSKRQRNRDVDELSNVDHIVTDASSSRSEAQLYIFEDNEAVIKMIIEGRSPMMRHVSRTHRVALDWLFDRINLDPKIQIKHVDTKNKLADMLTKGCLHLMTGIFFSICEINIMNLSMFSCGRFLSKRKQSTMSKTAKERKIEESGWAQGNLFVRVWCTGKLARDKVHSLATNSQEAKMITIWRSNHLHVNVQRCWLDKERQNLQIVKISART